MKRPIRRNRKKETAAETNQNFLEIWNESLLRFRSDEEKAEYFGCTKEELYTTVRTYRDGYESNEQLLRSIWQYCFTRRKYNTYEVGLKDCVNPAIDSEIKAYIDKLRHSRFHSFECLIGSYLIGMLVGVLFF